MRFYERNFDPKKDRPLRKGRLRGRLTRSQVAAYTKSIPVAPWGDYLWELTREIVGNGPLQWAQGRVQKHWVYHLRGKRLFARPWVMPANPRTTFQVAHRQRSGWTGAALVRWTRAGSSARG